jgi:hypothetical protein
LQYPYQISGCPICPAIDSVFTVLPTLLIKISISHTSFARAGKSYVFDKLNSVAVTFATPTRGQY